MPLQIKQREKIKKESFKKNNEEKKESAVKNKEKSQSVTPSWGLTLLHKKMTQIPIGLTDFDEIKTFFM